MLIRRSLGLTAAAAVMAVTGAAYASGSGSAGASSSGVAKAEALVAKYEATPTSLNITTPLTKRPPTGKIVAYLSAGLSTQNQLEQGVQDAAKELGWTFIPIQEDGTPVGINGGFAQALAQHANAIFEAGATVAEISTSLAATKAAGVPVILSSNSDLPTGMKGNGILAGIVGPAQIALLGAQAAEWVVATGHLTSGTVAFVDAPEAPASVTEYTTGFKPEMAKLCPHCKTDEIHALFANIGSSLPGQLVAALQQHPQIKFLSFAFGELATGVAAAIKAAGINGIQISGIAPQPQDIAALQSGTEAMWVSFDAPLVGWRQVDAYARSLVGDSVAVENNTLMQDTITTKKNVTAAELTAGDIIDPHWSGSNFAKLWLVK